MIGLFAEAVDRSLELDDRAEDAALETALGELGEEALDGVEPGAGGRREVEDEARVALQPRLDLRVFVRGVVVEDDVHDLADRHGGLGAVQKPDELLMAVALHAAADDLALEYVERGEERRRAVSFLIVRHGRAPAVLQGQPRLGPIERLKSATSRRPRAPRHAPAD